MATVHDHIYGHLLLMGLRLVMVVHVKAVKVLNLMLEIIIIVNQDIKALVVLMESCTPVILSGMVQGVRVKVVAAVLLHGSLWI